MRVTGLSEHGGRSETKGMSTLFISYSTKDRPTAEVFYDKLIEMGYEKPFRDDHPDAGIPAGSDWEQELYRKLRLCKAMIVLCSRNWLDSKWCFAELAYAKAMEKEFFPVLIDDSVEVPSVVAQRQAIKFSDSDIRDRLRKDLPKAGLAPQDDFPWPEQAALDPLEALSPGNATTLTARPRVSRPPPMIQARE